MALIGKIRRNSWILVVMIGLGLAGFIVMDMFSGQGPGGGGSQMVLGTVNGEKIDRQAFERTYGVLYQNASGNPYANRQSLWNYYVEETIISGEAEEIGLGVSREELVDLQFGDNPSPIIVQRFQNPMQPGTVDRQQLDQVRQLIESNGVQAAIEQGQISPVFVDYWRIQEGEIIKDRLQNKLIGLVTKGMYTPTWMAEMAANEQAQALDLAYVRIPYDEIPNDEVSVSDEEIEAYLEENRARFEREEETRVLDYVAFNVQPTAEDSTQLRNSLAQLANEFRTTDNDSNFVLRNEGQISPLYYPREELSPTVADTLLSLPAGAVYGPYIDEGAYRLVKIRDRAVMADSADTRHILVGAQTPDQFTQAEKTIDSLMAILQADRSQFDSLAARHSTDGGSAQNGGRYENITPGAFVPEFDETLFRTGEIGRLYKVRTQFGWHLLEVQRRKGEGKPRVQIAMLIEPIIPTKETQDRVFEQANAFLADYTTLEDLRQAVQNNPGLRIESSGPLAINDFSVGALGYGNETRDMVCWAFSASEGEVSPSVYTFTDESAYYDNKYVVAAVRNIEDAGLPSVDAVRDEIMPEVINRKKAELLQQRIQGSDLQAIAGQYNSQVDTVSSLTFAQSFVPGLGNEPKVIAEAFSLATGATSAPIAGQTGVFVIKPLTQAAAPTTPDLAMARQRFTLAARAQAATALVASLREGADVEDDRARFDCASI